jgi:ATP-dependent Lhr-like helicase
VFFADLVRAVGGFPNEVLAVLWQMVWAGEATNDTLEPLRARLRPVKVRSRHDRRLPALRPERDALRSDGAAVGAPRATPRGGEGRWSLRTARWVASPSETDRRASIARALLDRYGIVTREAAHAEDVPGGFGGVYEVLKTLEAQGRVRRGYFVEGRGGAQFAQPGADEGLRQVRDAGTGAPAIVLAATDPANLWGAILDFPPSAGDARPQRAAGAVVVLADGALLGWMGRGENPILTFLPEDDGARAEGAHALAQGLAELVDSGSRPALLVGSIDGVDASASPLAPAFARAGFISTARGLLKRRPSPAHAAVEGRDATRA